MPKKRQGGRVINWEIIEDQLYGDVYNDRRFKNGEPMVSSVIKSITVETKNSIYQLQPNDQRR